jgi:hypothetical protein
MNTATGFAEPLVHDTPPPFHELCARIHDRISAFLDAKDAPERLKGVQEQTRVALRVIEEALARYRWVVRDVNRKLHEADMRLKPARALTGIQWRKGLFSSPHSVSVRITQARPDTYIESIREHRDRRPMLLHPRHASIPRSGGVCFEEQENIFSGFAGICKTHEGGFCRLPQGYAISKGHTRRDAENRSAWGAPEALRPHRLWLAGVCARPPCHRLALRRYLDLHTISEHTLLLALRHGLHITRRNDRHTSEPRTRTATFDTTRTASTQCERRNKWYAENKVSSRIRIGRRLRGAVGER